MKPICIIHVLRDTGGVSKVVLELANEQIRQGIKVVVVHSSLSKDVTSLFLPEATMLMVRSNKLIPPMLFGMHVKRIYRQCRILYPDYYCIVHVHNIASVGLFSNIRGISLVCTLHGISWFGDITFRKKVSQKLAKLILLRLDKNGSKICAVSHATSHYYNELCGKSFVQCIHNGISTGPKRIEHEKFVVGMIADISYSKGWDILLEAYRLLPDNIKSDTSLIFAGRASVVISDQLLDRIHKYGLEENVVYLGEIPDAYHRIMPELDLLVLPSISEGLPMVLLEAQSLGIPVLATDVGGVRELIKDQENGLIIDRNALSIRDSIAKLFMDRELYQRMCIRSRLEFEKEFSARFMFDGYQRIYLSIIDKSQD